MEKSKFNFKYILRYVIWNGFKNIVRYPKKIRNQYGYYNAILSYIIQKTKSDNLLNLRQRNVYFINIFIILPMFIGALFSGISVYNNIDKYQLYIKRATLPIDGESYFRIFINLINRIYKMIEFQPFSIDEMKYIVIGFVLSIIGAKFLSLNPIFKKSKQIEDILSKIKKVDADEKPWKVIWTPDAVYFESFLGDPDTFVSQRSFWNTINFSPSPPLIDVKDRTKFIVPRKYELPPKIVFPIRQELLEIDYVEDNKDED